MKIGIIRNEDPESAKDWIQACKNKKLDYTVIDISAVDWLEQVLSIQADFFVTQPPGYYERFKTMFDERLYIISRELGLKVFPSFTESLIYENKKMSSYYFDAKNIPHPNTRVFYGYYEAVSFIQKAKYPFVAKTSIGAAGSGVKIIRSIKEAKAYIHQAFKGKGIRRRFGPNRNTGSPKKWAAKTIKSPSYFIKRLRHYLGIHSDPQFGYVIFQEYIPHTFEWRVVKIGDSYFAHKKMVVKGKASGGKVKEFGFPPESVLNYVKALCKEHNFHCVCVDLFESERGYLVNEIQCVFGIPYKYLAKVGDDTGRFIQKEGAWVFDKGDFTVNEACDLKLETAIKLFSHGEEDNLDK
jgi:glutathione synthase/RimK-type ligase-like ATP-grasp enzyme